MHIECAKYHVWHPVGERGGGVNSCRSIHRTTNNNFVENWVFSLKMYQFVREILCSRRNNAKYHVSHPVGERGVGESEFMSPPQGVATSIIAALAYRECVLKQYILCNCINIDFVYFVYRY